MIGSNSEHRWSVPEAKDAIRTAFFLRSGDGETLPRLRFKDLMDTISSEIREISVTTFNRARDSMVDERTLQQYQDGRETWYILDIKIGRETLLRVARDRDTVMVRQGSDVGATGIFEEGWTYYGVPLSLRNRLHSSLRREARKFQEAIDEILGDEFEAFIESAVRRTRKRIPARDIRKAKDALWRVLDEASARDSESLANEFSGDLMREISPGSVETILGKTIPKLLAEDRIRARFLAQVYDISEEDAVKGIQDAKEALASIGKLMSCLKGADRRWFVERFVALQHLGSSLIAVVR